MAAVAGAAAAAEAVRDTATLVDGLGKEDAAARRTVYLVTVSRILPETLEATDLRPIADVTREELAACIRDAFDNPERHVSGAGRPRGSAQGAVEKLAVFREFHASGEVHFHAAVSLTSRLSFMPAKRTLRTRHKLATHWSCSHTQWWSALRYGAVPSPGKPTVDEQPLQWTGSGQEINLWEESQEPFLASAWKRRREECEKRAAAGELKKPKFSKLDLTAAILDKGLKTTAEVMEYAQGSGTKEMQSYVHHHQRKLKEFLHDAAEWSRAQEQAKADREGDWATVCRVAAGGCPHGGACAYAQAAARIFERNQSTMSQNALAQALRAVLMNGPSKTTRTPLLVGPTNTGKTTLVQPFDALFGSHRVFHKPALGSKFALRNLISNKRFLFWDDYRPVQYAQKTIEVSTFLSLFTGQPFEIQVSQSFNDGNIDFQWNRGAVMTAKEQDLWKPFGDVTEEDVFHMQSRVEVFRCTAKVPNLRSTEPCPACMCTWIRDAAAAADARPALQPVLPFEAAARDDAGHRSLVGLRELAAKAQVANEAFLRAAQEELLRLGAVHVNEVSQREWQALRGWGQLQVFEQRRFLAALQ